MTFPAFKAGDSVLSGPNGGFDSHTLPPCLSALSKVAKKTRLQKGAIFRECAKWNCEASVDDVNIGGMLHRKGLGQVRRRLT